MKNFTVSCAVMALLLASPALAETPNTGVTITEKTIVQQKHMPEYTEVSFMDFDLNGDGTLSRDEVGEKLFELFDRDGNEVIDNIEMKIVGVMSFIPMEKETIEIIDYHTPGMEDKIKVTQQEFLETSSLTKFDKEEDGLTPLDFLGKRFIQVDVTDDKVIDLKEWKRAYADLVKPLHEEQFYYNN